MQAKEAEAKAVLNRPTTRGDATCEQFAFRWLTDYPREAASTNRTYRYALRAFLDEFGSRRLADISPLDARRWAKTVPQQTARVARAMFTDAVSEDLIRDNVFRGLRLESSRGRKDIKALSETEVIALAACAIECYGREYGPMIEALILTAGFTGARPGELHALTWGDIRGEDLVIERSLDSTGAIKLPKNGKARKIAVPPVALEALKQLPTRGDPEPIFMTRTGKRLSKSSHWYYFDPVRKAFGRPTFHFYELRHACATILLERGLNPAQVAMQLGHQDGGRLVQELYGHPSEDRARELIHTAFGKEVAP